MQGAVRVDVSLCISEATGGGRELEKRALRGILGHHAQQPPTTIPHRALHPARPPGTVRVFPHDADVRVPPAVHHEIHRPHCREGAHPVGDHGAHRPQPCLDARSGGPHVRPRGNADGVRGPFLRERDHRDEGLRHEHLPDDAPRPRRRPGRGTRAPLVQQRRPPGRQSPPADADHRHPAEKTDDQSAQRHFLAGHPRLLHTGPKDVREDQRSRRGDAVRLHQPGGERLHHRGAGDDLLFPRFPQAHHGPQAGRNSRARPSEDDGIPENTVRKPQDRDGRRRVRFHAVIRIRIPARQQGARGSGHDGHRRQPEARTGSRGGRPSRDHDA